MCHIMIAEIDPSLLEDYSIPQWLREVMQQLNLMALLITLRECVNHLWMTLELQ